MTSQPRLTPVTYRCECIELPAADSIEDILRAVQRPGLRYALAHCDDGVVWGRLQNDNAGWLWSSGVVDVSPPLRAQTLLQLRLFGADAEVFLWREGNTLRGRLIAEGQGERAECLSEAYLLWGEPQPGATAQNGFLPLCESGQGFRHAPPAEIARAGKLTVRHYVAFDAQGCPQIVASRLVADV